MAKTRFYESSNGDVWDLVKEDDRVYVLHQPNVSSGGIAQRVALDIFLGHEKHSAQVQALVELIGKPIGDSDRPAGTPDTP